MTWVCAFDENGGLGATPLDTVGPTGPPTAPKPGVAGTPGAAPASPSTIAAVFFRERVDDLAGLGGGDVECLLRPDADYTACFA